MELTKTKKIHNAIDDLEQNNIIYVKNGSIWLYSKNNILYYGYEFFGRSATKATINNLKWIFRVIFNQSDYSYNIKN